jgi:mRNA interferase MazF
MATPISVRDIWLVRLNDTVGHEQRGNRPVIVLAVHPQAHLVMVTPFTGNIDAGKFPYTHQVGPTDTNGLSKDSVAQIYQTRNLAYDRFIRKLGEIDDSDYETVKVQLRDYCGLDE